MSMCEMERKPLAEQSEKIESKQYKFERIEAALLKLLSEKVYRVEPALVRNDSRASKIVSSFVSNTDQINKILWLKFSRDEISHEEYQCDKDMYDALAGLSEESLRKYIRKLWQLGRFDSYFR